MTRSSDPMIEALRAANHPDELERRYRENGMPIEKIEMLRTINEMIYSYDDKDFVKALEAKMKVMADAGINH